MDNNSKEMNFNRKTVTLGNYTETCEKLKEPVYKRGSKEKAEQIKRWETERSIFKKKDNSFTQINADFKPKKQREHESYEESNTLYIGNHSVYIGSGKYKFERFGKMRILFMEFIKNAHEEITSKSAYVNAFFSNCYLFACGDEIIRNEIKKNKGKAFAYDLIYSECFEIFKKFVKQSELEVGVSEWYIGYDQKILDSSVCKKAEAEANKSGEFKWNEFKKRQRKVNEILMEWKKEPIDHKYTRYRLYIGLDGIDVESVNHKRDMTRLYEVLRHHMLRRVKEKTEFVPLGYKHVPEYKLNEKQYQQAKEFIEKYICFYDKSTKMLYYSEEDIA